MSLFPSLFRSRLKRKAHHAPRRSRNQPLSLEAFEQRITPTTDPIPLTFTAPQDVIDRTVAVAIVGNDSVDKGTYFDFSTEQYVELTSSTDSIPLHQLTFTAGTTTFDLPNVILKSGKLVMFIGTNSPATLPVVDGSSGALSVPTPTVATHPNNAFGLFELTNDGTTYFMDTSNVDQIGFPFTATSTPDGDGLSPQGVGISIPRETLFAQYSAFLSATQTANPSSNASAFAELATVVTLPDGTPSMIVAPADILTNVVNTQPKLGAGSTSGGNLDPATDYSYEITAINANGAESAPGPAFLSTTGAAASNDLSNFLVWSPVPDAKSYNIYRKTGTRGTFGLLASTADNYYTDNGSIVPSGQAPPSVPATPGGLTATPENTPAGTLTALTTYYYEVTSVGASGAESSPSGVVSAVVQYGQNSVDLTWGNDPNASSYNVYRSDSATGPFALVTNVSTNAYVDTSGSLPPMLNPFTKPSSAPTLSLQNGGSLAPGQSYAYVYTAVTSAGESLPSASASTMTDSSNKTILVQLSSVSGATSYNVYRSTAGGAFEFLANTTALSFGDNGSVTPKMGEAPPSDPPTAPGSAPTTSQQSGGTLDTSTTYFYQFTAITSTGETLPSDASAGSNPTSDNRAIQVSWTAYAGATGYKVYRSTSANGPFELLVTLVSSKTSYTDTGIWTPGAAPQPLNGATIGVPAAVQDPGGMLAVGTYYYKFTATRGMGQETQASNLVEGAVAAPNNALYLSWAPYPLATGYNIYRSSSSSGPFTLYDKTSGTSYTDLGKGGTGSSTEPPVNNYSYDPLNDYFTQTLKDFFDYYKTNTFELTRDGYVFTGNSSFDGTYVVLELTGSYIGTLPAGYPASPKVTFYAPFFQENYLGDNPFFNDMNFPGVPQAVPAAPVWMTDSALSPGAMVFGASGSFNTGESDPDAVTLPGQNGAPGANLNSDIENSINAALNRGIATAVAGGQGVIPPDNWANLPVENSATGTTGGSLTGGETYHYRITTVDSLGESPASLGAAVQLTNSQNAVTVGWGGPDQSVVNEDIIGYNVYRSTNLNGPWFLLTPTPIPVSQGTGVHNQTTHFSNGTFTWLDTGTAGTQRTLTEFYPAGSRSNYYSAFLHQSSTLLPNNASNGVSIDGLAYAFAYDDQGGVSSTFTVPTSDLQALQINLISWNATAQAPNDNPTNPGGGSTPMPSDNVGPHNSNTDPGSTIVAKVEPQNDQEGGATGDTGSLDVTRRLAIGADAGGSPLVQVFDVSGNKLFEFLAYDPAFTGGVRVATGDFNNDGVEDIVTGAGSGGGPHVRVFDGTTGALITEFFAYVDGFTGGVFVAVGDLDNDGFNDIITGAGAGGGPHVRAFSGAGKGTLADFFAYDAGFLGGVTVAMGDLDNDGFDDIITGAGAGGGPHVRAFSGAGKGTLADFFALDADFTGGVFVGSGDLNGDAYDELIVGSGAGDTPQVRVFSGTSAFDFFAFDASFPGGTRVNTLDRDGDGDDDIVVGAGPGGAPIVRTFATEPFAQIDNFFALDGVFGGGLFVG